MQDDRLSALEDDVKALRAVAHDHGLRLVVVEDRAKRAEEEEDRLRAVELGLARLATGQRIAVAVLVFVIPILVRLFGGL